MKKKTILDYYYPKNYDLGGMTMPTVSVKQYFQQKPNSYVPTIVTTKPSGSVTASVSYTPAKATISKDVVTISDAAKRAYEQKVSKNQVSNTLTNQVVQSIS
ncbi:hypothetical protein RA955_10030 [Geobacillus proteiniphilus]|uniref:Uncharacterized protein n=2 Tax=Geobacillus proteiniphilus TaxID=860353 RepID=A0ABY9MC18_9BACL|nr:MULTISPECIES: hypothetical protein [Geobacillus]WMJ15180.1 hypothetical protein RA955_10030 [Geobacillus proteiniphilus]